MNGRELGEDTLEYGKEKRPIWAQQVTALDVLLVLIKEIALWEASI